ncbi:hypothetical protein [Streptomyces nojiriensis]|uniref:hypothetical protein n=1 Tax=Streptomyces nojiriensis TaxID=66374 RepID=UPI001676DC67|nr:hypothetical protein [Streptomyces nojiriensis]QTI50233.1 hypothetical protein JYK04_08109 [Streptomyces nojiriensis]GGS29266.1 hypothetical protein GCM10010205_69140 [Streptomyces nojiriensis]
MVAQSVLAVRAPAGVPLRQAAVYLMHGLLLPDTLGQRAIRAKIDEMGLGEAAITAA